MVIVRLRDETKTSPWSSSTYPRNKVPLRRAVVDETEEGCKGRHGNEEMPDSLLRRSVGVQIRAPDGEDVVLLRWLAKRVKERK